MLPGNGLAGVKPLDVPTDAIGVRYQQKVIACEAPGNQQHILFSASHLTTDGLTALTLRALEVAVFSMSPVRPHPGDNGCPGWPPPNVPRPALWCRAGHNPAPWMVHPSTAATVGLRTLGAGCSARWPHANHGADNISGLTVIDAVSQYPILGKTFAIEKRQMKTVRVRGPQAGWGSRFAPAGAGFGCSDKLPPETYAEWQTTIATGRWRDKIAVRYPTAVAMRLDPFEALSFFSEFLDHPGAVQIQITKPEVLRASTGAWQPLTRWVYYFGDAGNIGYGPRPISGGFEFANDGSAGYLTFGSSFTV